MEMIRISDTKLKIMMSAADLTRYPLGITEGSRPVAPGELRRILESARESTGFCAEGVRIFVQAYPARDGGCELFVTKLGAFSETGGRQVRYRIRQHTSPADGEREALEFASLEPLLRYCRFLRSSGGDGRAYLRDDGSYILVTEAGRALHAAEFGARLCPPSALLALPEHSRLLTARAAAVLGSLAT